MKLYTEEELLKAIQYGRDYYDGWVMTEPEILKQLTPIELPSDEAISKHLTSVWFADNMQRECFKLGSIWMKTQILNQNK